MNCKSDFKFIPDEYKYGSYKQRLELLKGLMDTDGGINRQGTEYYTVCEKLADDVCWLVRSLGGVAKKKIKRGKYLGNVHLSFRVKIFINEYIFKLSNKLSKQRIDKKKYNHQKKQAIINIEKLDYKEKQRCIQVDCDSHLFLTNDFTITHNCSSFNTIITIKRENSIIEKICLGNLYYEMVQSYRKLTFLEKIKINLYKIYVKI